MPPCPMASACLRAQLRSPGWQTGARLRVRWPAPGESAERAAAVLTQTRSSPVWALSKPCPC